MGYVLAVARVTDQAPFAIKMLNPELATDPQIVGRFLQEARAAQAVTSKHVCRVFDVGTLPTGTPYLVMERLHGVDLATLMETRGAVPFVQAVDWMLEACEALAEAHAQRYVHRDLKPSNLFLATVDGASMIKVLDFGIAKSLDDDAPSRANLTTTAAVIGSPAYMSPEQLKSSKSVDVRSDIWSLGVVLYELLTAVVPFAAPTLPELSVLILTTKPRRVTAHDASLPADLANVIDACLRRDRGQRFGNLAELASHLAPFGSTRGADSAAKVVTLLGMPSARIAIGSVEENATTAAGDSPERIAARPSSSDSVTADAGLGSSRRMLLGVGAAALVLVALVATAYISLRPAAVVASPPVDAARAIVADAPSAVSSLSTSSSSSPSSSPSNAPDSAPDPAPGVANETTVDASAKPPASGGHPHAPGSHKGKFDSMY